MPADARLSLLLGSLLAMSISLDELLIPVDPIRLPSPLDDL
jgi:hypothetical protein